MRRLPELSYRLAHHLPDALPFFVPFYMKMIAAGFAIDEKKLKPVLRRNGVRVIVKYSNKNGSTVGFHYFGKKEPFLSADLGPLNLKLKKISEVADYSKVDKELDRIVANLQGATEPQPVPAP